MPDKAIIHADMNDKEITAYHWGDLAAGSELHANNWLCSPQLLWSYVFPRFGGVDWYHWLQNKYCCPSRQKAISICCGIGVTERHFLRMGLVKEIVGIDLSPEVIVEGNHQTEVEGIEGLDLQVGDVESMTLEPNGYDMALSWMAMHHIQDLEGVYAEIAHALVPGGIIILNEYIGPRHFAFEEKQSAFLEEWITRLPSDLRCWPNKEVRTNCIPDPGLIAAADPSEAVRSDEIVSVLSDKFKMVDRIDYGGGLLHFLLGGSMWCFDWERPDHRMWLERVFNAEREAMIDGWLQSDFTFVVAEVI